MAKISVLIPVYNAEKYLIKCLDSLVNQTLKDIEIICINDGSKDNSAEILDSYAKKDCRIKVIHQSNVGQGETRNRLLNQASGDYIGWVDADDWVSYDYYEKLYDACLMHNSDVAIANTLVYISPTNLKIDDWVNSNIFKVKSNIIEDYEDRANVVYSCAIWNKIYKRELANKLPKFNSELAMDDVPFNFGASILANKLILVADATYYYRKVQTSVMNTINDRKRTFGIFAAGDISRKFLKNNNEISDNEKKIINQIYDNFEVINIFGYLSLTSENFKDEFFDEMKKRYQKFDFSNNRFKSIESNQIYEKIIKSKNYKCFKQVKSNNRFLDFKIYEGAVKINCFGLKFSHKIKDL
ncbi:glycosyltransferase family 2 protein [bacterium]|nr:glycosyltransferase family 2 protein [bacterium]